MHPLTPPLRPQSGDHQQQQQQPAASDGYSHQRTVHARVRGGGGGGVMVRPRTSYSAQENTLEKVVVVKTRMANGHPEFTDTLSYPSLI